MQYYIFLSLCSAKGMMITLIDLLFCFSKSNHGTKIAQCCMPFVYVRSHRAKLQYFVYIVLGESVRERERERERERIVLIN
jgi:hypothetical protein